MACTCCQPAPVDNSLQALLLILSRFDALEALVATAAEQIDALTARVDAQGALLTDVAADFAAFKTAMEAERENLTAAGQAAVDRANASLDSVGQRLTDLDIAVGDADGSDTPPVEPEPTPEPPIPNP
jgi:uncharacterized coiled-coil protein SlyX